jgi:hypothetical protein
VIPVDNAYGVYIHTYIHIHTSRTQHGVYIHTYIHTHTQVTAGISTIPVDHAYGVYIHTYTYTQVGNNTYIHTRIQVTAGISVIPVDNAYGVKRGHALCKVHCKGSKLVCEANSVAYIFESDCVHVEVWLCTYLYV